jgi:hypothetical protein
MNSTDVLTVNHAGELTVPAAMVERFHIDKDMRFRVIGTDKEVLLIPLTSEPMSVELKAEIEEWQAAGADGWGRFGLEESESRA